MKNFFNSKKISSKENNSDSNQAKENFLKIAKLLRETRENIGLSRIELSNRTKISPIVIESIENADRAKLPEQPYLIKMLSILEKELDLKKGSLDAILNLRNSNTDKNNNFSLENLDIFSSWQGNIIYILLILLSVFFLNYTQRKIAIRNSRTNFPILPDLTLTESPPIEKNSNSLITLLTNQKVNSTKTIFDLPIINHLFQVLSKNSLGDLELDLTKESMVIILSDRKMKSSFENVKGKLKIRLKEPILIKIIPPITESDTIKWKGNKYTPKDYKSNVYKLDNLISN